MPQTKTATPVGGIIVMECLPVPSATTFKGSARDGKQVVVDHRTFKSRAAMRKFVASVRKVN